MSCSHNLSSRIIFKQLLDSIIDGSRECHIVSVEASMYLAAKAKDIGYFFKVQILNPVRNVSRSPKWDHNGIQRRWISKVAFGLGDRLRKVGYIGKAWKLGCGLARPRIQACISTVWNRSVPNHGFGPIYVIGSEWQLDCKREKQSKSEDKWCW